MNQDVIHRAWEVGLPPYLQHDFTQCPRVPGRAYNGSHGKKIAVYYHDDVWILIFNSCISEHLGSTIYRMLGIPAQETLLGIHVNGREKLVCACKDFTTPGIRLHDFCSIKNTVLEGESGGTGTELNARIFSFPASMLKVNGKKIGYYDFLHSDQQPAMLLAVREELQPKIAALDIEKLINDTPYLTDLQRQFYTTYLNARREKLFI